MLINSLMNYPWNTEPWLFWMQMNESINQYVYIHTKHTYICNPPTIYILIHAQNIHTLIQTQIYIRLITTYMGAQQYNLIGKQVSELNRWFVYSPLYNNPYFSVQLISEELCTNMLSVLAKNLHHYSKLSFFLLQDRLSYIGYFALLYSSRPS